MSEFSELVKYTSLQSAREPREAKVLIDNLMEELGDGSEASDDDLDRIITILYQYEEKADPVYRRNLARIIDERSDSVKTHFMEVVALGEWTDMEDVVYGWKEEQADNEEFQKWLKDYETRKARGLNIPLQKALVAIAVAKNVDVHQEPGISYVVEKVISKYPGPPKERAFKKWLRENWEELNPYPTIGRKKPRWIQEPEWPTDKKGKPLTFIGQVDVRGSKVLSEDSSYYIFQDLWTGEAVVVVQMY